MLLEILTLSLEKDTGRCLMELSHTIKIKLKFSIQLNSIKIFSVNFLSVSQKRDPYLELGEGHGQVFDGVVAHVEHLEAVEVPQFGGQGFQSVAGEGEHRQVGAGAHLGGHRLQHVVIRVEGVEGPEQPHGGGQGLGMEY